MTAPASTVPAPRIPGTLTVPCWGCEPASAGWAVRFQTDLDVLAPLGNGSANAAVWLKDFAREVGSRAAEADEASKRRVSGPADLGKVLPPEDPLLREAAPWADQATMRFYPDVFALEGFSTRIPNLAFALTLGKSWVARALAHPEEPSALEDCRRAVRWGRLLRQDDVTVIQDLIGLAVVRAGAQGLYDLATRAGDTRLALAAAIVLGEHAPQRLRTAQVLTRVNLIPDNRLDLTGRRLDGALEVASASPDRRFRAEAISQLALVRAFGTSAQRGRAEKVLDTLVPSPDPVVSGTARWVRTTVLSREELGNLGAVD